MNEFQMQKRLMKMQGQMQSDMAGQESQNQLAAYAPQLKEQLAETQAAIVSQSSPVKGLIDFLRNLKGEVYDQDGDLWMRTEPLVNSHGLKDIKNTLSPIFNESIRWGNVSEEWARKMSLKHVNDFTEKIGLNWREWGIKDETSLNLIVDKVSELIVITLSRSVNGGERIFVSKVVIESLNGNPQKKRGGGWLSGIGEKLKFS